MNLYHDLITDHYKHPRHQGKIKNANINAHKFNPLCGDIIQITGIIKNNYLIDAAFEGSGCVISQASASLLLEYVMGKTIEKINKLTSKDIQELLKIDLGPTRAKCATLSLITLQEAIKKYQ